MGPFNRRQFIKTGVVSATLVGTVAAQPTKKSGFHPASEAGRGVKVACSTNLWRKGAKNSLKEALTGIAQAGYDWVEVDVDDLWDFRDQPEAFKSLLAERGLGLVTASLTGNFADREHRLKNISRAVLASRALEKLGAGVLVIEGSWGDATRDPHNFHTYSTNLAEVGALVYEETGLHCAYRFREQEAADVRKIIATSDSRYIKFCPDTQYLTALGIDPVPMIKAYGTRVIHIHLRDGAPNGSEWRDEPVGSGKVNAAAVLEALCQTRYNGWVTVQQDRVRHSAGSDARESLRAIQPRLEAAVMTSARDSVAESGPPHGEMGGHPHHAQRRGLLQDLVVFGATLSTQPAALLKPAAFTPADQSNPMQQITHDMHGHRGRPVTPLPPQDPNFKPLFFTEEEYRDVSALADAIIPVTETPGALDARADEYADLMIWLDQEHHNDARKQIEGFRGACSARYGHPFAQLSPAQRNEFLTAITGKTVAPGERDAARFFSSIRGLTVKAFYASPAGLLQDLGYKGNTYVSKFVGCTHPEHKA